MSPILTICFISFNDKCGISMLHRNKKCFYNCFSFYSYAMVTAGYYCVFKKFLVTDQLVLGKKMDSQFLIFLILYLHCWYIYIKSLKLSTTIMHTKMSKHNEKRDYGTGVFCEDGPKWLKYPKKCVNHASKRFLFQGSKRFLLQGSKNT